MAQKDQFVKDLLRITPTKAEEERYFRFSEYVMDLESSLDFDKEQMLLDIIKSSNLTVEEFAEDYVIEEYPIHFIKMDDLSFGESSFKITQEFRIRPKTPEEKQEESIFKEKDVDPD